MDLVKKTTIGIGKEKGDLYYFEETDSVGHFWAQFLVFRSDNGEEYLNQTLADFFHQHGIFPQTTCVYFSIKRDRRTFRKSFGVMLSWLLPPHVLDYQTTLHMLFTFHSIPDLFSLDFKLLVDEILGLNQSGADLQTDIEPQGESPSAVKGKENSKKILADIVSNEVDEADSSANPSFDTTTLFQSTSREHAFVVASYVVQTSNTSLLSVDPNNSESLSLNPIGDDQEWRCTSYVRNKPDRFVFSSKALEDSKWKFAMVKEMKALQANGTWDMVNIPDEKRTVGRKWVFTVKHKPNGSIERYKARFVAKG
ncbi:hypothetical protein Prudu_018617 [Prunus dulcis]|uniref:Transposable element protein n=1 Tax=Prunus dulcis TaxID=3755 RepID=A0A4Y1RR63_PRUDU|nr:hypothetical protein Prudu_018617 [Prunus dulcis]